MSIAVTPVTKLKKPLSLILKGETVALFHHEKGSSYCVVEFPNGESKTAALCDLDYVGKAPGKGLNKVPKKLSETEVNDKKDLNSFFDSLGDKVPYNCQNCRKAMYAFGKPAKRASCAHILAKAKYPSIAKNPDNILFLGVDVFGASCYCHSTFDQSVEKRMRMPIYDIAIKRYNEKLKQYLTPKEIIMAEEDLGIRIKSQNLTKELQEVKS